MVRDLTAQHRHNKMEKHIVSDILIFNQNGELALQMRAENDKSFPKHWDFSAGGHIDAGENSQKAAEREIFEELGISGKVELITRQNLQYQAWKSQIVRDVDASIFKMLHNGPFEINKDEVMKIRFFKLEDIQKMKDTGEKFHPEFLLIWDKGIVAKAIKIK
jgi:isopentenyl-diphosphate Delta-isomerase